MKATIQLELKPLGEHWAVAMDVTSDDPTLARCELYRFTSEEEAREGLYRALGYAEDLRKHGMVQQIEVSGENAGWVAL